MDSLTDCVADDPMREKEVVSQGNADVQSRPQQHTHAEEQRVVGEHQAVLLRPVVAHWHAVRVEVSRHAWVRSPDWSWR